jgi:hypothetical protein
MDEPGFIRFLKRMGKQDHVVDELVQEVQCFDTFLGPAGKSVDRAAAEDIQEYADLLEANEPGRGRKRVRGLALYYRFSGQEDLAHAAHAIREQETAKTRKIFPLREFRDVNPDHIACLEAAGITHVEQMLAAGKTPKLRAELCRQTGISPEAILELVKLSDLSRLGAVKSVRARLYYEAGVDTIDKFAAWETEDLLIYLREWVERTGFDGIAPLPKELANGVAKARSLERIVEYNEHLEG